MPTPYHTLLRRTALLTGMLVGETTPGLETSYITTPLTKAEIGEGPFPFTPLTDAVLGAEKDFVDAIAHTGNHPWRQYIRGLTTALADRAAMPTLDVSTKQIVGIYGSVYDSTDGVALTEMPIDVIIRRVRNAGNRYRTPVYYYKFDGGIIRHTRTAVIVEVCVYDQAVQAAAIAANGNMLLPDVLGPAIADLAAGLLLGKDGGGLREYAATVLASIRAGGTSVQPRSVPVPITKAKAG